MGYIYDLKDWCVEYFIYVGIVEYGVVRKLDIVVDYIGLGVIKWSVFGDVELDWLNILFQYNYLDFLICYEMDWYCLLMGKLIVNVCINLLIVLLQVKNGELLIMLVYLVFMKLVFQEVCCILRFENEVEVWEWVWIVCG